MLSLQKSIIMKDEKLITALLANEQTYLAWLRTGVAVMAFGFVAVKFSLFVSQIMGIILVGCGAVMTTLAYFRYRKTIRQLRDGHYVYSSFLLTVSGSAILVVSGLLLAYLIEAYLKKGNDQNREKQKSEAVSSHFT